MLVDALLDAKRRHAGKIAVSDGTTQLTYAQLVQLTGVFRRLVPRHTHCKRVGIMLPASSAFPALFLGTLWAHRIAIPLNFLLAPDSLARVVADAEIDCIFTVGHFRELASKLPAKAVFLEELSLKRRMILALLSPTKPPPEVEKNETAVILFTSGTSSEPKGVELTYDNLRSNCADAIDTLQIDPDQRFLNVLPPFHVFGLTANVLVPIVLGASVHALPRFNPLAAIRLIASKKLTVMMAIPSMYAAMLRSKSAKPEDFASIYLAISGGEPLADGIRARFEKRFDVVLRQGYGLTETSPVVAANSVGTYREGSVGIPLRNVQVRITNEQGQTLSNVQDGEIHVRGPSIMKGYYKQPDATRLAIDADGWFHTGDIGHVDTDGFLWITGRAKEMLIIAGENVAPREIEQALEAHPSVSQVAVIGTPDDSRGEVPVAFVIPQEGVQVDEQELRQFAKKTLAGFKVPRKIVVRDDLPKGPTGKILKRRLSELLVQDKVDAKT